jgi:hypothetical protein
VNFRIPVNVPDWLLWSLLGFLALLILVFVGFKIRNWIYHLRSKTWPNAGGRIISSAYRPLVLGWTSVGLPRQGGYEVKVKYSYFVNGREYAGSRLSFKGAMVSSENIAERMASNYSSGDEVKVYYCPKKPWLSVLITDK